MLNLTEYRGKPQALADFLPWAAHEDGIDHLRVVPTADINTTLGMSITVFLLIWYVGIAEKGVVGFFGDFVVSGGGEGDDDAGSGFDFLQVGHRLFVAGHGLGTFYVAGCDDDYGKILIDEGVGAVLHFSGRITFGVDVGNFF